MNDLINGRRASTQIKDENCADLSRNAAPETRADAMLSIGTNNLLDALITKMKLKNDAALARRLRVAPPVMSKLRHGRLSLGAVLLLRMHEETGLPIAHLRALAGHHAKHFGQRHCDTKGA